MRHLMLITATTRVGPAFLRHAYPRSTSSAAHYVGIGKQSGKGTAAAPTVFPPYQAAVDLGHGMEGDDIRQAGTGPYVARTLKTKHDPSGGFGMAVRPKTFAQCAAWFLGADASVLNGSLYDHTATPSEIVTWITAEHAAGVSGDIIDRLVDAMFTKMSLSIDGNGDVMSSFSYEALTAAWQATAATPSQETGVSGSTPGGPYRASEATYTIDGAGSSTVAMVGIDLEWKLDDVRLSQVVRGQFLKLELSGKVKVKQLLDDAAKLEYRKVNYGTVSGTAPSKNFYQGGSLVVALDNGLATTNQRTLGITIPSIDWKAIPYTALNPDGATMFIEREGTIVKGAGAFITVGSKTADVAAY